jgi:hypothetical protein
MARATAKNDAANAFDEELWLWFFAGILRQRWKNRHQPIPPLNASQPVNKLS